MTTPTSEPGPAPANLADLVRVAAASAADRPAIIGAQGTRTWAELDAAVDAGASQLAGYPPGERAVLALPTGPELAAALFAVLRAGLVAVPVDPARTDLSWVARRVGAAVVVTDSEPPRSVTVLGSSQVHGWWSARAEPTRARVAGEDLALLARASRVHPPVMLSHRALLGAARALRGAPLLDIRPADRVLQVLPLFHVVGLVTAFLPAALAGAAVVIPDTGGAASAVEAALESVSEHRVSILPAEPTLYRQLDRVPGFERALATVRLMTSGSSPLDPADFAAIRAATGQAVREGYGISESAAAVTSTLMTETAHPGSVGLPYPGVQIRIADDGDLVPDAPQREQQETASGDDGDGTSGDGDDVAAGGADTPLVPDSAEPGGDEATGPVDPDDEMLAEDAQEGGEVGHILIRGDTLFSGYWPDGEHAPGPDGWFRTGDIGYLDDAGELHLVDRAAETVTIAGFTVYPREVEDVLVTHPYVADAAVVGFPGRGGPTVVAALVPQPGKRPTQGDLDEYLTERLPPFKRPTGYQLVDALPRTEVGRLDRDAVQQDYARYRGITLGAPPRLGAAAGSTRESGRPEESADGGGEAAGAPSDTAPEAAAGLDRLGVKLPSHASRTRRSAEDTDEDLF